MVKQINTIIKLFDLVTTLTHSIYHNQKISISVWRQARLSVLKTFVKIASPTENVVHVFIWLSLFHLKE